MTSKKILVADDSLTIQKVIRLALSNEGYEIQVVSDGKEAMAQINLFRPEVVLVDVSLPIYSAFDLKREVNALDDFKNLKFILMSSAFEQVDEAQVEAVRFDGRLIKPFDPGNLRKILAEVFSRKDDEDAFASSPPPLPHSLPSSSSTGSHDIRLDAELWIPQDNPDISAPPPFMAAADAQPPALPPIPPPSSPPPLPPESHDSEEDIRQLTESTIRMSGLDNFEWGIHEPSLKSPEVRPPQSPLEIPNLTSDDMFQVERTGPHSRNETPSEVPPPQESGGKVEMNRFLQNQVESEIRKLLQDMLPDIAERIVKEELRKMLQNPP